MKGFTLLEIIIVVIILAILASMAIPNFTRALEKGRAAEARANLGYIRNLARAYYLENGNDISGFGWTHADMGNDSERIPTYCRPSHYYRYAIHLQPPDLIYIYAFRCTSGGKPPDFPTEYLVRLTVNLSTGDSQWEGYYIK